MIHLMPMWNPKDRYTGLYIQFRSLVLIAKYLEGYSTKTIFESAV